MFMRFSIAVALIGFTLSGCITTNPIEDQLARHTPQTFAAYIDAEFGGDANAMNTASVDGKMFATNMAERLTYKANKPLLDVMFSRGYNPNVASYLGEGSPLTATRDFDMQQYFVSKGATFEAAELLMEKNVLIEQSFSDQRSLYSPLLQAFWFTTAEHVAWLIKNGSRSIVRDTWSNPVLISRQGKTDDQVLEELVRYAAKWDDPKIMKGFVLAGYGQLVERVAGRQVTAAGSGNAGSGNDTGGAFAAMLGGLALGAIVGGESGDLITSATSEIAIAAATDGNITSAIGSAANLPELEAFGSVVDGMIKQMDGAPQSPQATRAGAGPTGTTTNTAPPTSRPSSPPSSPAQHAAQSSSGSKTFVYDEMFRPVCPSGTVASQDVPIKANNFMCYQAMKTYAYAASCNMVDDLKSAQDQYYSACAAEIYAK